jgi:acyl-CoA synthetase (NDP forming)
MKINSSEISHKSEVEGVFTNILNSKKIKKCTKHLSKITPEILMEKMITDTIAELIIGIKIDNQFGPVIVIGAGGIYTELFRDTVTLLTPINKKQALEAINNLKISKIIKGYRGKGVGDLQELVSTIIKISKFAEKNVNKITEVDINPLIVRKKGKGVIAVDAIIYYSKEIR